MKLIREGTNRTEYLRCKREQTVIIFQNFTQELVEWENGGVPRIDRIRKDGRHVGIYAGEVDEYIPSHITRVKA